MIGLKVTRYFTPALLLISLCAAGSSLSVQAANDQSSLMTDQRVEELLGREPYSESGDQALHDQLMAVSGSELGQVVQVFSQWLMRSDFSKRERVLRAVDVLLREHKDFDGKLAKTVLKALDTTKVSSWRHDRLSVALASKAGLLDGKRAGGIINRIVAPRGSSAADDLSLANRTALLGALIDSEYRPTSAQMQRLIACNVPEVRIHAVAWFRLTPLAARADRVKFLRSALDAKPYQVREGAYRTIASFSEAERIELGRALAVDSKRCRRELASASRLACESLLANPAPANPAPAKPAPAKPAPAKPAPAKPAPAKDSVGGQ